MTRLSPTRKAIWLASVAAAIPTLFATFPLVPAEATTTQQFSPPDDTMVLTRTLRRPFSDGEEVLTRRSYEIRFVPEAGGYRIDGRLLGVEVDAPPGLEALATLERRRPDTGMFPMRVDAAGRLMPEGATQQAEEVRLAGFDVGNRVNELALDPFDKAQARNFAKSFEKRSARTAWPEDLFHPVTGTREETQTVPLPNGARGTVKVSIEARAKGGSGLLGSFVRRVTTSLGGDSRITEETWTLAIKG